MTIFKHKTDAMRQLLRLVSHGYHHWTAGEVEPRKAEALQIKFSDRYGIEATAQQRYRRKAKGHANAQLVMWASESVVEWILLATEGDGLVHQLETLRSALRKPERISVTGYELLKTPRQGKGASAQWTWRMSKATYEGWQERLRTSVRRKRHDQVANALDSLRRVPGFAGSRRQAFALEDFAQAEWKRIERKPWPFPALYVGWLGQYKKPATVPPESVERKI